MGYPPGGSINWAIEEIIVLSLWQSAEVLGRLKVNQVAYPGAYGRKSGGFGYMVRYWNNPRVVFD